MQVQQSFRCSVQPDAVLALIFVSAEWNVDFLIKSADGFIIHVVLRMRGPIFVTVALAYQKQKSCRFRCVRLRSSETADERSRLFFSLFVPCLLVYWVPRQHAENKKKKEIRKYNCSFLP